MKKSFVTYVCLLLTGLMLYSCKPSDEKLQQQVQTALAATPGITSEVKDGIVTLTGTVASEEVKTAAETAVNAIKGIKSVADNIQVEVPVADNSALSINPDQVLTQTITSALNVAGFSSVSAAVADGIVTLTGSAKRVDLKKIMQIANDAKPKQVLNKLTLN
jgi:osmotically-inducible protein OsmY